jgi:hypothetical protein
MGHERGFVDSFLGLVHAITHTRIDEWASCVAEWFLFPLAGLLPGSLSRRLGALSSVLPKGEARCAPSELRPRRRRSC